MKLQITPRPLGEVPIGALAGASLFFLPLGAWLIETELLTLSQCGFKRAFDLPCLSCGSTRATIHLLHGELFTAIAFQPLTLFIYALLLVWGGISFWALIRRRAVRLQLTKTEDVLAKVSLLVLPLLNWAYLVSAGV